MITILLQGRILGVPGVEQPPWGHPASMAETQVVWLLHPELTSHTPSDVESQRQPLPPFSRLPG